MRRFRNRQPIVTASSARPLSRFRATEADEPATPIDIGFATTIYGCDGQGNLVQIDGSGGGVSDHSSSHGHLSTKH